MLKMFSDFTLALVFCFTKNVSVKPHFNTNFSAPLKKMTYFMEGPPKLHIEMDSCRSQQCVGSSRSVQRQQCFKAVIVVGSDNRIKISFSGVEPFSDLALLCLLRFFARKNVVKMLRRCQPHFSCYNIIFICVIFISSSVHSGKF